MIITPSATVRSLAEPAGNISSPAHHDSPHRVSGSAAHTAATRSWITSGRDRSCSRCPRRPPATPAHQLIMIHAHRAPSPAAHTARPLDLDHLAANRSCSRCPREARRQHQLTSSCSPLITPTEIRALLRTPRPLDLHHLAAIAHALDAHAKPAGNQLTSSPDTMITPTESELCSTHRGHSTWITWPRSLVLSMPTPSPPAHSSSPAHHDHAHRDPEPCSTHRGHSILDHLAAIARALDVRAKPAGNIQLTRTP
jgi:hypothetical protein